MAALFEKFLESCTLFMTPNSTKLTNLLRKRYQCADENYKNSAEFTDLLSEATQKIQAGDGQIFVHIQTVNHELKAYARKNRTINVAKRKSTHSETNVKRCILSSFEPIQQCSVLSALNLVPVNHSHNTGHSSAINSTGHTKFTDDTTLFGFNPDDGLPTISSPCRRTTLKSSNADDSKRSKLSLSKRRREDEGKKSPKRSPRREDEGKGSPRSHSPRSPRSRSPRSQSPRSKCLRVDHRTDEFVICRFGKKDELDTDGVSYENDFVSISFNDNSDSEKSNESTKPFAQRASTEDTVQLNCIQDGGVINEDASVPKSEPYLNMLEIDIAETNSAIDEKQFTNILSNSECNSYVLISPIKLECSNNISENESVSNEKQCAEISVDKKEDSLTTSSDSGLAIKLETDYNSWHGKSLMTSEDKDSSSHIKAEEEEIIPPPPKKVERISTLSSVNKTSLSKGKMRHLAGYTDRKGDSDRESPETTAPAEEVVSPKAKAGSQRQIKELERLLTNIDRKIRKVKEKELSLADMEDDDSAYILEDKLEKKFMKVWNRLCELKGRDKSTGRVTEKKFVYQGTRYPEVNTKISKFVNKKKTFPNYRNIHAIISFVNEKKGLRLRAQAINDLARESFQDVGNLLQNRRKQDYAADFGCHITDTISAGDPASQDRELRKKLEENDKVGVSRLDQVISKYVEKQMMTGEVPQEFSHSDSDDNNVDVIIDDDDDDDVVAAIHDSDMEQGRASTPVTEDIKPLVIEVDTPVKDTALSSSGERSATPDDVDLKDPVPRQNHRADAEHESNLNSSILILEPDCNPIAVDSIIKVENNDCVNEPVDVIDENEQKYAIETENYYANPSTQVDNNSTNETEQPVQSSVINSECAEPNYNSNENGFMCLKIESVWSVADIDSKEEDEMPVDLLTPTDCDPEPENNDDNDVICVDIELLPGSSQEIAANNMSVKEDHGTDALTDNAQVVCVDQDMMADTSLEMPVSNEGAVIDTDENGDDTISGKSSHHLELCNNDENDVVCVDDELPPDTSQELMTYNQCPNSVSPSHRNDANSPQYECDLERDVNDENDVVYIDQEPIPDTSPQELATHNECSNSVSPSHRDDASTPQFDYDLEPDTNDENDVVYVDQEPLPDASQVNDVADALCIDISEPGEEDNHVTNEADFGPESITENNTEYSDCVDPEYNMDHSQKTLEIDDVVNLDGTEADCDDVVTENKDEYDESVNQELCPDSSQDMFYNDEVVNIDGNYDNQIAEPTDLIDGESNDNDVADEFENDDAVNLDGNEVFFVSASITENKDEYNECIEPELHPDSSQEIGDVVNIDQNEDYFDSELVSQNNDEYNESVDQELRLDSTQDMCENETVVNLDENSDNQIATVDAPTDDLRDVTNDEDEVVDLDSLPGSTQDEDEPHDMTGSTNDAVYAGIPDVEEASAFDNQDEDDEIVDPEVFIDSSQDLFENTEYDNLESSIGGDKNDKDQIAVDCISTPSPDSVPEADNNDVDDDEDEVICVDHESVTEPDEDMDITDADDVHSVSHTDNSKDNQESHSALSPEPDVADSHRNNDQQISSPDLDHNVDNNTDNDIVFVDQESDSEPVQDHDDVNDSDLCNDLLEPTGDNPVSEDMLIDSESAVGDKVENAVDCAKLIDASSQDKLEDDERVNLDFVTEINPDEDVGDVSCTRVSDSDNSIQVVKDLSADSKVTTSNDDAIISTSLANADSLNDKDDIVSLDSEADAVETVEVSTKASDTNVPMLELEMECFDVSEDVCTNVGVCDQNVDENSNSSTNDSNHAINDHDEMQVETDTDKFNCTAQNATAVALRNIKNSTSIEVLSFRTNKTKTVRTSESPTKLVSLTNAHLTTNVRKRMQKRLKLAIVNSFQKQQTDNSECSIVSISPVNNNDRVSSSADVIEIDCTSPSSVDTSTVSANTEEELSLDSTNQKDPSSGSNDDIIVISVKKNDNPSPRSSFKSTTYKVGSTPRSIIKRKTSSATSPSRHSGNSVTPSKRVHFSPILKIRTNIVGNVPLLRGRDRHGAILARQLIQNQTSYSSSRPGMNNRNRSSPGQGATSALPQEATGASLPRRTIMSPFWPGNNSDMSSYRASMQASARVLFEKYLKSKAASASSVQVNPISMNHSTSNSSTSRRQPLSSGTIPRPYSNTRTIPLHVSPLITSAAGVPNMPNVAPFRTPSFSTSRSRTIRPFNIHEQSRSNSVPSNAVNRTHGVTRNSTMSLYSRKNTRTVSPLGNAVPLSSRKPSSEIIILD